MKLLHIEITSESVRKAIIQSKLKLKEEHITTNGIDSLRIIPPPPVLTAAKSILFISFILFL